MAKTKNKKTTEEIAYAALHLDLSELENKSLLKCNSHHLSQKLAVKIAEAFLPKQQRKIYEVLTKSPQRVGDIAEKCGLSSNLVSVQLQNIKNNTLLVQNRQDGHYKLWYRTN